MTGKMYILMPHAEPEKGGELAPRLTALKGKTIGFVDNVIWSSTKITFQEFEAGLRELHGIKGAVYMDVPSTGTDRRGMEEFAAKVDCAILGLAN